MNRISKIIITLLVAVASTVGIQTLTTSPASAATCSTTGPSYERLTTCTGIGNEVLSAKFSDGRFYFNSFNRVANLTGTLTDKIAGDSKCTYIQVRIYNAYYSGAPLTNADMNACGGNTNPIAFQLYNERTYPGTRLVFEHCAKVGGQSDVCSTIFSRTLD